MSQCPVENFVDFYRPDGTLLTHTNDYLTYAWIRAQIKEKQLRGYYIMFNGEKVTLDRNGTESHFPNGMMEKWVDEMMKLI